MMRALFNEKGAEFRIEILQDKPVQDFIEAHASVLDSSFEQVEMSDAMRRRLQRSDYIFSGLKTFHELNEAFPSLLDEKGDRKPFERFLNDVRKIDSTYNRNYLRAEYNFASASAEMAARWEQFTEDGDRYHLQYRTASDSKVRPEHAALHGVTLPIDDPFWEQFTPPNGWNCRCSVVQVRKSKYPATPHDEAMALGEQATQRDTRHMFRFNPGKEQKTFPDYNPYTISKCKTCNLVKNKFAKDIPDNDLCAGCQIMQQCWAKVNKNAPEVFTKCETENGELNVSSLHGRNEKKENVRVGTYLANKYGYKIDLIANPQGVPSADSFNHTLGVFQEYKVNSTPTKSSIDDLIRKGYKQAEHIVLFIDSDISLSDLSNALNDRVRRTTLKDVMVVINGKDHTYTFEEITAKGFIIRQTDLT